MTSVTSTDCSECVWSIRGKSVAISALTARAFFKDRSRSGDFNGLEASWDVFVADA